MPVAGLETVQNSAPQNGAAHYAREHGRLQTVDWANIYRKAAEPERNGR